MSDSRIYYITEQKDIFQHFAEKNLSLPVGKIKILQDISRKTHNNYIGYYQFLHQGIYHKFFVIPKIHKHLPDKEKEAAFMDFLLRFYALKNKYPRVKAKDINGNISDFSFAGSKTKNSVTTQEFIKEKYAYAVEVLHTFFRKHNRSRTKRTAYVSQSVRHRLDLIGNLRSLDKSKVHQTRREEEAHSLLAFIAQYALRHFKKEKIGIFEASQAEVLRKKTGSALNIISKRYKPDASFRFKDRDIITNKFAKIFKKTSELKKVYEAILVLLGLEHFAGASEARENRKINDLLALFFHPADLFEWLVYDYLQEKHKDTAEVCFDKLGETKVSYTLFSGDAEYKRESKPDFVVKTEYDLQVIDAKWKILKSPEDIQFADIAKLKRDTKLQEEERQLKGSALLVYPQVSFESLDEFREDYDKEFSFTIETLDL